MSGTGAEKDPARDFVSKLIATIIFGCLVAIVVLALSAIANHLINGEDTMFVVVGFMTHAANLVIAVAFVYSLFRVWSDS